MTEANACRTCGKDQGRYRHRPAICERCGDSYCSNGRGRFCSTFCQRGSGSKNGRIPIWQRGGPSPAFHHGSRPLVAKSCRKCGVLKDAASFALSGARNPVPDPTCRDCHNLRRQKQWGPRKVTHRRDGKWLIAKTCHDCDVLLPSERFYAHGRAGVSARCRSCEYRRAEERTRADERRRERRKQDSLDAHRRYNAETLETAGRRYYQWTGPEWEMVAREDLTIREAAVLLGRTFHAVKKARERLKKEEPLALYMAGASRKGVA